LGDQLVGQCGEGGIAHKHAGCGAGIGESRNIKVGWQSAIDVVASDHLDPARHQISAAGVLIALPPSSSPL
jgi:hypothetical protein